MDAAAQQVGLESGLAVERNKAGLDRALAAKALFDDAHACVRE